ncbi:hypothetical protein CC86DRAFT_404049 [Ophiobolus disseminans]|uniref:Rhodopsin domain-containing protein n=1 Tax=Ophiobolus disseminans TaxID=1469910 RepID=A0A6A7A9J9_9PLEO|nr:hypothetical protein CC86DRAFT_404049 [Ophiobolus disseminans]
MALPPKPSVPIGGDQTRARELLGASWTLFAISACLVIARMYTRAVIQRNVGWDDWTIVLTLAFILAFTVLFTIYSAHGGSRHTYYLTPYEMQLAIKYNYIANVLIVIPLCTGKVSVALLIQRLLPPGANYQRWFLYFVSGSLSIVITFVVVVILCQCRPVESLWDPNIEGPCWDSNVVGNWNLFAGSYFAFMDFALALFPILLIRQLQMSIWRKLALSCLLGLGVFAGVCAIVKSTYLPTLKSIDFTWDTTTFLIWNATETNVIIIAACIPTLSKVGPKATALFKSYFSGSRFSSKRYAIYQNDEGSYGRKSEYMQHRCKPDEQSLELPTMRDELVPSGRGSTEVVVSSDPRGLSEADIQVQGRGIRQTLDVEVEHSDQKRGR